MIDNGGSYSDHTIWFVETDYPREVVEKCVAIASSKYMTAYIAAVINDVSWLGDAMRTSLGEYVSDGVYGNGDPSAEARELPDELLEQAAVVFYGVGEVYQARLHKKLERNLP
jgi:hypothetical protein